jgi:hypothetical protein
VTVRNDVLVGYMWVKGLYNGTKCSVRGHSCVSSIIKRSDAIAVLITVSAERVVFRKV